MAKRNKYEPKPFESIKGSRLSANIYASMMQSEAFIDLNAGAVRLYLYMKLQLYGAKNLPEHPQTDFVFNQAMATKVYPLYTNTTQFRKDIRQLVEHGLIEIVEHGKNTRTKNIYRFSDKWQSWKKSE